MNLSNRMTALFGLCLSLAPTIGCSSYEFGTNGPLQEANPQHEEELVVNPLTGETRVRHRSNDNHRVEIEEAKFTRDDKGLKTVTLKGLKTTADSESIRLANVKQKEATYKGITMWSDSFWNGLDKTISNAITAATPLATKWIDANPKADKATIETMMMKFFQQSLADQLINAGGS